MTKSSITNSPRSTHSGAARISPIVTLIVMAPVVSELLYGAVRISDIPILLIEVFTWGCGALLIRESVRRWGKGWKSMLLMGLALAVAEDNSCGYCLAAHVKLCVFHRVVGFPGHAVRVFHP